MTTDTISPLRQRMLEDMNARKLCAGTQRGHIGGCKRPASQATNTEKTNGEPTPPAITSFSPARSGA
jgi:hypothetical protein